jgi:hypothetical protein
MEISARQYRADAERCRKLAEQADNPVRRILYNHIERSYLNLAEGKSLIDRRQAMDCRRPRADSGRFHA